MSRRPVVLASAAFALLVALGGVGAAAVSGGGSQGATPARAEAEDGIAGSGGEALATPPAAVTMADREAATAAVIACLRDAGYEVLILLPGEGLRTTRYSITGVKDVEGIHAANAAWAECRASHSEAVNQAWLAQQRAERSVEQLEDLHDRLMRCMAAGGNPRLTDAHLGRGDFQGHPVGVGFVVGQSPPSRVTDIPRVKESVDIYAAAPSRWRPRPGSPRHSPGRRTWMTSPRETPTGSRCCVGGPNGRVSPLVENTQVLG
ncbi:MAG: hypothetical protein HY875_03655 [Chloroflexi bacterium]|nr:hypothetical protein [Chloroflexota bacterium]